MNPLAIPCSKCEAEAGKLCREAGAKRSAHQVRVLDARAQGAQKAAKLGLKA